MIDGFQRRGWDSNPCAREDKRFSRPPRYDRFGISPYSFLSDDLIIISPKLYFVNTFLYFFFIFFFYFSSLILSNFLSCNNFITITQHQGILPQLYALKISKSNYIINAIHSPDSDSNPSNNPDSHAKIAPQIKIQADF